MRILFLVLLVSLVAWQSAGLVLHRSFRTREAGFGLGTGKATVAYPVDAKVDKALDEAAEKDAAKANKQVPLVEYVSNPSERHKDKREM